MVAVSVKNGVLLAWSIPATTDAVELAARVNAGDIDALLDRIAAGHEAFHDGNNWRGRIATHDAERAADELGAWHEDAEA